jgi:hypothetical protein
MRHLDTEEGRYHALRCVEAKICKLYQMIEARDLAIKDFTVAMEINLQTLNLDAGIQDE